MSGSYNETLDELTSIIVEKNARLRKLESLYNGLKQENERLKADNKSLKSKNDIMVKENVLLSNTFLNQINCSNTQTQP
jgi:hypothetical protein